MQDILMAELLNVSECARHVIEGRSRLTAEHRSLKAALKRLEAVYTDMGRKAALKASVPADQYEIVEDIPFDASPTLFAEQEAMYPTRRVLDLRESL